MKIPETITVKYDPKELEYCFEFYPNNLYNNLTKQTMFNKTFINVLIKIQLWTAVVGAGLGIVYAIWLASAEWDFFEGMGIFLGITFVSIFYASLWYIIFATFYKYHNK